MQSGECALNACKIAQDVKEIALPFSGTKNKQTKIMSEEMEDLEIRLTNVRCTARCIVCMYADSI